MPGWEPAKRSHPGISGHFVGVVSVCPLSVFRFIRPFGLVRPSPRFRTSFSTRLYVPDPRPHQWTGHTQLFTWMARQSLVDA